MCLRWWELNLYIFLTPSEDFKCLPLPVGFATPICSSPNQELLCKRRDATKIVNGGKRLGN